MAATAASSSAEPAKSVLRALRVPSAKNGCTRKGPPWRMKQREGEIRSGTSMNRSCSCRASTGGQPGCHIDSGGRALRRCTSTSASTLSLARTALLMCLATCDTSSSARCVGSRSGSSASVYLSTCSSSSLYLTGRLAQAARTRVRRAQYRGTRWMGRMRKDLSELPLQRGSVLIFSHAFENFLSFSSSSASSYGSATPSARARGGGGQQKAPAHVCVAHVPAWPWRGC
jgi:hypothetical protein